MQKSEKALFEEPYEGQLFFEWSSTLKSEVCIFLSEINTTLFKEPFEGQLEM